MKSYDVHAHLYDTKFDKDRNEVIQIAKTVLSGIIVVGEDITSNRQVIELVAQNKGFLYAGLAIHPCSAHMYTEKQIDSEIKFIREQDIVCIGEAGLDYMIIKRKLNNNSLAKEHQINTLKKFIALSKELDIPLNLHSRWATKPIIDILEKERAEKVLLHAFSGSISEGKRAIALGYKLSIGNTIAFAQQKKDMVAQLPLESFLLETDSPVCAAKRGERNEPKNITEVVKAIAKIKNISEAEVISITNKNVKQLFKI